MAAALGGVVSQTGKSEFGRTEIKINAASKIFTSLPTQQSVWMSHGDAVTTAPSGFTIGATTVDTPIAAFENETGLLAGVQFHPEFTSTPRDGHPLFSAFIGAALIQQDAALKQVA